MIDYRSIGKRIRRNRNRLGMTQEILAEKVNVSIPHISRMENGTAKPSLQTLVDICNTLNISIDDLMQDNLSAVKPSLYGRLGQILEDCSIDELNLIIDVVETIVRNIRKQ